MVEHFQEVYYYYYYYYFILLNKFNQLNVKDTPTIASLSLGAPTKF